MRREERKRQRSMMRNVMIDGGGRAGEGEGEG